MAGCFLHVADRGGSAVGSPWGGRWRPPGSRGSGATGGGGDPHEIDVDATGQEPASGIERDAHPSHLFRLALARALSPDLVVTRGTPPRGRVAGQRAGASCWHS